MFINFRDKVNAKFNELANGQTLYLTDVTREELWDVYLKSFPEGTDPIYRERSTHDCNCCRQFIRPNANVVAIDPTTLKLISIWDVDAEYPYNVVAEKMSAFVKSKAIRDMYLSDENKLGTQQSFENGETVKTYNHFYYVLPTAYVNNSGESVNALQGKYRASRDVFYRSMKELTIDAGETILELISQNSLYRGEEFKKSIEAFVGYKKKFDLVPEENRVNWCWENAKNPVSKIRNTAIGTLLIDLSENEDLNVAVSKFESVVAPTNYKRPNAIYTKRQVEEAEKKISDVGLTDSLLRRHAVTEDITANNVLFLNRDAKKTLGIFDELKDDVKVNPKNFDKIEEVQIDDFVSNILPNVSSIEMMVENKHQNNLMSLVAPQVKDSKSMFKWENNFSWAYNGNITDSLMKERVKSFGGKTEGVLRFSIQWNDEMKNSSDLDAHSCEPNGNKIYYQNKGYVHSSSGMLDVDIVNPNRETKDGIAVENIIYTDLNKMHEGDYDLKVHNYSQGRGNGFTAEIEFDGVVHSFRYEKSIRSGGYVTVATVNYSKANGFAIKNSLDSSASVMTKEVWGINTNKFEKVSMVMFSPNHWDEQTTGNKHYFFILDKCKNESTPRGFFNEFLKEELMSEKRVFEALGGKLKVEESDDQLSGVGFSSTQRNSVVVKVEGKFTRTIKLVF